MARPRRLAASKVSDYRTYHLSGDLDDQLQGRVGQVINLWEDSPVHAQDSETNKHNTPTSSPTQPGNTPIMSDPEALRKELEEKRAANKKAAQQAEEMKLRNELEEEELKKKEWDLAMSQMKEHRAQVSAQHAKTMEDMKKMAAEATAGETKSSAVAWLQDQLRKMGEPTDPEAKDQQEKELREKEEKKAKINELKQQQQEIALKLAELTGEAPGANKESQDTWFQQLQAALESRGGMDPQKAMIRALTTQGNKTAGPGGVNLLRPDIIQQVKPGWTEPGQPTVHE